MMAYIFMRGSRNNDQVLKSLEDDFALGNDNYPRTIENAFQVMMVKDRQVRANEQRMGKTNDDTANDIELNFLQSKEYRQRAHHNLFTFQVLLSLPGKLSSCQGVFWLRVWQSNTKKCRFDRLLAPLQKCQL